MKKIMFNDKYGLTQAVLNGNKTMTRRVARFNSPIRKDLFGTGIDTATQQCVIYEDQMIKARSTYAVGEVVAIAQSYETLANSGTHQLEKMLDGPLSMKKEYAGAGYKNKMYVKAGLMPHHIRITAIRVEELQSISSQDCLREGIHYDTEGGRTVGWPFGVPFYYTFAGCVSKQTGKQLH